MTALLMLICLSTAVAVGPASTPAIHSADEETAATIFENRIMPIFRSTDPSSCVQCHLSSVDLKNYILPSHRDTFLSLRDQGLIDLNHPAQSKILHLIEMGETDPDPKAERIHAEMRQKEHEAFAAWIKACCEDSQLRDAPGLQPAERARPAVADPVIRHSRKDRVIDSFTRNIWSQRLRCFPCHTRHEIGKEQTVAQEKFDQWYAQFGDRMLIFRETPAATMEYLASSDQDANGDRLPLLNLQQPSQSLLVIKPTSKIPPLVDGERVPTYQHPVYHGGGLKMHPDDHSYKAFIAWIEDFARVSDGGYASETELPRDNWHPTQKILRMRDVPESWPVGTPVQMFLHQRTGDGGWSTDAIAFTQGTITPRQIVNGPMILLAPSDPDLLTEWQQRPNRLPPGDYQVRVFLDQSGRLQHDPAALLDASDFRGSIELTGAQWQEGFPKAEWITANDLTDADP